MFGERFDNIHVKSYERNLFGKFPIGRFGNKTLLYYV